jgi:TPR repeat protein
MHNISFRHAAHLCVAALLCLAPPALAQSDLDNNPPTMEQVEQAWRTGDFVTVRDGLKYLAEETGTALAQYRYGRVLIEGRGGPRDPVGAMDWLTKAAEQNHTEAMTLLGRVYLSDLGSGEDQASSLQRDPARAAELLTRAAALGDAEGQYYLAMLHRSGTGVTQDAVQALNWLLAAARQNHVEAQYELSIAYAQGQGTEPDNAAALEWLTAAAGNGHVRAQYFLALSYETGRGVAQDAAQAINWYLRAAEAGLPIAQRNLGTHYLQGEIVARNVAEGLRWLEAAAAAGDAGAMGNLGHAYANGMGVAEDEAKAAEWYHRAAENGLGRAMVALGLLHEQGKGVEVDIERAIALYTKALETADQGQAAIRLGQLAVAGALDGKVAPHNAAPWVVAAMQAGDETAEPWLIAQAEAGVRPAMAGLAALYLETEERAEEGARLLEETARAGDAIAQAQLGQMYMTGTVVELDYVAAHTWFNIAATLGQSAAAGLRETVSALMTPEEIAEAQAAARLWFEEGQRQPPATDQDIRVTE